MAGRGYHPPKKPTGWSFIVGLTMTGVLGCCFRPFSDLQNVRFQIVLRRGTPSSRWVFDGCSENPQYLGQSVNGGGPMITSRFNVYSTAVGGRVGVFNTRSLNFVVLSEIDANQLRQGLADADSELFELGFMTTSHEDDVSENISAFQISKSDEFGLAITIVPTLSCNFSCSYCSNGVGYAPIKSSTIQDSVIYVKNSLRPNEPLSVTWYGGEPLLVLPEIERGMESLRAVCAEFGSSIEGSLLTNGALLTAKTIDRLLGAGIDYIQVSCDLPFAGSDRHSKRRSAEELLERCLRTLDAAPAELSICLRINARSGFLSDLKRLLPHIVSCRNRLVIDLQSLFPSSFADDVASYSNIAEMQTFYQEYDQARRLLYQHELWESKFPKSSAESCSAAKSRQRFFTPDGERTCIREVVGEGAAINKGIRNDIANEYLQAPGWSSDGCRQCTFLPLCNGGCPKDVREGRPIPLRCTPYKFTLKGELDLFVERLCEEEHHADHH